jgi:hypothetical protein
VTRYLFVLLTFFASLAAQAGESAPNVLILGDGIYQNPAFTLNQDYNGSARIVFATAKVGLPYNSAYVRDNLDSLISDPALGSKKWDLIFFTVGLVDLVYHVPDMTTFRTLPKPAGGVLSSSPKLYEENLNAIIKGLKATGSKIVWVNIQPTAHVTSQIVEPGSEIPLNAIAEKIMKANGIPIADMHAHLTKKIKAEKDQQRLGLVSKKWDHHLVFADHIQQMLGIKLVQKSAPDSPKKKK